MGAREKADRAQRTVEVALASESALAWMIPEPPRGRGLRPEEQTAQVDAISKVWNKVVKQLGEGDRKTVDSDALSKMLTPLTTMLIHQPNHAGVGVDWYRRAVLEHWLPYQPTRTAYDRIDTYTAALNVVTEEFRVLQAEHFPGFHLPLTPLANEEERPMQRFPMDALPDDLREFVVMKAHSLGVAYEVVIAAVFTVLSAATTKHRFFPMDGWDPEVLVLQLLVSAESGERKSASIEITKSVYAEMRQAVLDAIADDRELMLATIDKMKGQIARQLRAMNGTGRKADGDGDPELLAMSRTALAELEAELIPLPPVPLGDVTSEKVAQMMAAHGGRVLVTTDEGGFLANMAGRYSSGEAKVEVFNAMSTGGSYHRARTDSGKTKGDEIAIDEALGTTLNAVQPGVIRRRLLNNPVFVETGVMARLLYTRPLSLLEFHQDGVVPPAADPEAVEDFTARAVKLMLMSWDDPTGEPIVLTPANDPRTAARGNAKRYDEDVNWAELTVVEIRDNAMREMKLWRGVSETMASWWARAAARTYAIASLMTLYEDPEATTVGQAALSNAREIVEFYAAEMERLEAGHGDAENEQVHRARRILDWLGDEDRPGRRKYNEPPHGVVTDENIREALSGGSASGKSDLDSVRPVIEILTGAGFLAEIAPPGSVKTTRRRYYAVHPSALSGGRK